MCEVVTIDWLGINDPEEKDIMRVVCERGSRLIFIHFGVLLPCFMGYAFAPVALPYILNRYLPENMTLKRSLCVHIEAFIDQDKYFNYIFCLVIHMVMLVLLITCALDLAYTSCITYIMGKIIWIGLTTRRSSAPAKHEVLHFAGERAIFRQYEIESAYMDTKPRAGCNQRSCCGVSREEEEPHVARAESRRCIRRNANLLPKMK
ncbi:unnamed protein product [Trichogramma brassicae]|uniref:Uncharacterized protein n=1 Tax=Trichogramma brassicae TaxID=86971 RepID=A0A6H5IHL3_9HYME|nr:unnamed protein product [Trichogramma brassicae]